MDKIENDYNLLIEKYTSKLGYYPIIYITLKDVNDSDACAKQLAQLLKGMNAYVNLIPYNQVDEHGFKGCDEKQVLHFYDVIMKNGVKATIRAKHGDDIDAACGQLRGKVV